AASDAQILEQTRDLAHAAERREELAMVQQIIDHTAAGGPGVTGLEETLAALHLGQVHKLVIDSSFYRSGVTCTVCGRLTGRYVEACPACGGEVKDTFDVVERAIMWALSTNSTVEIVHGEAADLLRSSGGIGAQLRYVPSPTQATA